MLSDEERVWIDDPLLCQVGRETFNPIDVLIAAPEAYDDA